MGFSQLKRGIPVLKTHWNFADVLHLTPCFTNDQDTVAGAGLALLHGLCREACQAQTFGRRGQGTFGDGAWWLPVHEDVAPVGTCQLW